MSSSRKEYLNYSPIRAKRRQSDAKWRASVATCYDTLKYVVPNMKNMSKRKISKALILQESEKHIKELEAVIRYLTDVECPAKGKTVLWREGQVWSNYSLDKLKQDFSDKQQQLFHSSNHGRRCYKLLHNIKEEVFSMQADPSRLAFIGENTTISALAQQRAQTLGGGGVDTTGSRREQTSPLSKTTSERSGTKKSELPSAGSRKKDTIMVGWPCQSYRRPRAMIEQPASRKVIRGLAVTCRPPLRTVIQEDPQSDTAQVVPSSSCRRTEIPQPCSQAEACFLSRPSGTVATTAVEDSAFNISLCAEEKTTNASSCKPEVKDEDVVKKKKKTALLLPVGSTDMDAKVALRKMLMKGVSNADQEVPSFTTLQHKPEAKRAKLDDKAADNNSSLCAAAKPSPRALSTTNKVSHFLIRGSDLSLVTEDDNTPTCSKVCSHLTNGSSTSFSSSSSSSSVGLDTKLSSPCLGLGEVEAGQHLTVPRGLKMEMPSYDFEDTMSDSLQTPKFERSYGSCLQSRLGTARKRLCFSTPNRDQQTPQQHHECPAPKLWSPTVLSPPHHHNTTFGSAGAVGGASVHSSPMMSAGFTPIKLPEDFLLEGTTPAHVDNPFSCLISPWKDFSVDSSRHVPTDYLSEPHLDDSLLCLETMDSMDIEGDHKEITPEQLVKLRETDNLALTFKHGELTKQSKGKLQPKCRKKLDRLYDEAMSIKQEVDQDADSQVVPQVGSEPFPPEDWASSTDLWADQSLTEDKPWNTFAAENQDFDGFLYYYRQVGPQLKQQLNSPSLQCPRVALHVARLWARLPGQEKTTLATLARLDSAQHGSLVAGNLSPDLLDVDIKPVDPQQFIPSC